MTGICNVDTSALQMMTAVRRTGRVLPLVNVSWYDDRPRDACGRRKSPAATKGYKRKTPPASKGKSYTPQPLTPEEMLRLLEQCNLNAPFGRRDYALLLLMWRTGLRIACEALRLEPYDVDLDRGVVHVRDGKFSKARFVGLDPGACERLRPWYEERAKYPPGPLFCVVEGPSKGGRLGAPYVRTKIKEYAKAAGIQKRVHPHGLRHTMACELAGEMPMHLVQQVLGHTSLATTAVYLRGVAPTEMLGAVHRREFPGEAPAPAPTEDRIVAVPDDPVEALAVRLSTFGAWEEMDADQRERAIARALEVLAVESRTEEPPR